MQINTDKVSLDMLGDTPLEECPAGIRQVARNILVLARNEYFQYNTMVELDKVLTAMYWKAFDGLYPLPADFTEWYVKTATYPEYIRRARQWLVEHKYLFVKGAVLERAQTAGEGWRKGFR